MQNPEVTKARDFNAFGTNFEGSPEPIYGSVFLPRKFKIAVTVPGDNSVDLFTNDVGVVVITSPEGQLQGYDIVVGGGMGRAHRSVPGPLSAASTAPPGEVRHERIVIQTPGSQLFHLHMHLVRLEPRSARYLAGTPTLSHGWQKHWGMSTRTTSSTW